MGMLTGGGGASRIWAATFGTALLETLTGGGGLGMGGFGVEGGVLTSIAFGAVTSRTALLATLTVGGGFGTGVFGVVGAALTSIAFC